MWKVEPGFYQESLIDCFEHQGTLVTVHSASSYPQVKHSDGTKGEDVPHIEILVNGGTRNGQDYYTGTVIRVSKPSTRGRTRELIAWECKGDEMASACSYIAQAKEKLDSAVLLLKEMDVVFEEGYARIVQGANYKEPFIARVDYEQACADLGVSALSDKDCLGYGVRNGVFSFPEYEPDFILKMAMAGLRLRGIELATTTDNTAGIIFHVEGTVNHLAPVQSKGGQLWEPCESCGNEPSYLPLHVCAACWPK